MIYRSIVSYMNICDVIDITININTCDVYMQWKETKKKFLHPCRQKQRAAHTISSPLFINLLIIVVLTNIWWSFVLLPWSVTSAERYVSFSVMQFYIIKEMHQMNQDRTIEIRKHLSTHFFNVCLPLSSINVPAHTCNIQKYKMPSRWNG